MQFERPERVVQNEQVVDTAVRSEVDLADLSPDPGERPARTNGRPVADPDEIRLLQRPYLKDLAPGANPPAVGGLLAAMSPLSIRTAS